MSWPQSYEPDGKYESVELRIKPDIDPLIRMYAMDRQEIYGHVPVKTVEELIQKHGGLRK